MTITLREDRKLEAGDKVAVYKNLHKNCFSVQNVKTGLVVAYADCITLVDVTFKVNQKGRARVRFEGRKNVHAFVVGTYQPDYEFNLEADSSVVTYNPYYPPLEDTGYFYDKQTFEPVHSAKEVTFLASGRVYYTK